MRAFRWGLYATYNGQEYNTARYGKEMILISHNHKELSNGFKRSINDENYYTKTVSIDEVSNIYEIVTYIKYKNHKFLFEGSNDVKVRLLCIDNPKLAMELGGELYYLPGGKNAYAVYINENDIEEVIEEKIIPIKHV